MDQQHNETRPAPDGGCLQNTYRGLSPEEHDRLAVEAVIAENRRAAAAAEADRLLAEEQQAGIERVLIDAADKLDQLADAVSAGKEIHKAAAWALAAKLRAMCRFRVVSDDELRRYRLRELMLRAWPNPSDWPLQARTFRTFGANSYTTDNVLLLRDCLLAALGFDYEDEINSLLYIDESDGPSRGLTSSEKEDLKEALEGLHGEARQQKRVEITARWREAKEAEFQALQHARRGQARAIWENKIRHIQSKLSRRVSMVPPNSAKSQESRVQ